MATSTIPGRFYETTQDVSLTITSGSSNYVQLGAATGYHPISVALAVNTNSSSNFILGSPFQWQTAAQSWPNWAVRIYNHHSSALTLDGKLYILWIQDKEE